MRNKIVLIAAVGAVAFCFCGCSAQEEKQLSKYTIDASLSQDNVLTASVVCDYVNNTDVPLDEVWFHL